jgi:two-component system LytT family response regulator
MVQNERSRSPLLNRIRMPQTLRVVIADDETLARQKLRILLSEETGINIVAECSNGAETIRALRDYRPDLLLLDVQMPDMDGFEVLASIAAEDLPLVIFTTAYDQYALKAFEAHALDYLLKPFDHDRLHGALERARTAMLNAGDPTLTKRLLAFLSGSPEPQSDQRLVIRAGGRVVFLDAAEIEWIEAAGNYVRLHAGKDSYVLRGSIGRIAERLDAGQFVRIHRSTLVNVNSIRELQPCNSGEFMVILRNGKELSCSRGYRSGLQSLIENTPLA